MFNNGIKTICTLRNFVKYYEKPACFYLACATAGRPAYHYHSLCEGRQALCYSKKSNIFLQNSQQYHMLKYSYLYAMILSAGFACSLLFSCQPKQTGVSITAFNIPANWSEKLNDTLYVLHLDYTDALKGFRIPSVRQTADGNFSFSFSVSAKEHTELYYKIYYQNQSYSFPDGHPYEHENFYGSWEDTEIGFKKISIPDPSKPLSITDHIAIVGNPRNEKKYFDESGNNRWQRNPRTGVYAFMLVVLTKQELEKIPTYIQHIALPGPDSLFVNPFSFFRKQKNMTYCIAPEKLHVIAKPELGRGVYVNKHSFSEAYGKEFYNLQCSEDSLLYAQAPFEIFINYVDPSTRFENIPVIKDIFKDGYSKTEYNFNRAFYRRNELIATSASTTEYPCENVYADPTEGKIVIQNPASTHGNWRKESTGIISRHGFTYGKIRVKAKLTPLLNKDNMWNGLTNAIWMIYQGGPWNHRRTCDSTGYMATYWGGGNDARVPTVDYSEIDFEILKTVSYCPDNIFPPVYETPRSDFRNRKVWDVTWPEEIYQHDADIVVACTNWDMACPQPNYYTAGCQPLLYKDKTFTGHRWDHNYRALTQKTYAPDSALFGSPYYYFEIEWKPTEIFWRIGPEPEKMQLVGYMNEGVTTIPNNQMLLIITQEFHNTRWWPGTPYEQHFIPFPESPYVGEIYEVSIE